MKTKPYLVIPKLIEQPTWGGSYIVDLKGFGGKPFAGKVMIGQSYELFSGTKLYLGASSEDSTFTAEIGYPDHDGTDSQYFPLREGTDYMTLEDAIHENPQGMLGNRVLESYGTMPLLIKINHAKGNSFQLHIRPGQKSLRWKPKAESWYYLEDGLLTYGIKHGASVSDYKACCKSIEQYMKDISHQIQEHDIDREEGISRSKEFIRSQNPWQFVNVIDAHKDDLIDLSGGGLHHSWEEDEDRFPVGNVIYEVQQDVMDPVSTIRSFDQGKIKKDGSIREIAIDDYFAALDTDPEHNDIRFARRERNGDNALMTRHYAMDVLHVNRSLTDKTRGSFVHLYVKDGSADVTAGNHTVRLSRGASCFVPAGSETYAIDAVLSDTVIFKTYIPEHP